MIKHYLILGILIPLLFSCCKQEVFQPPADGERKEGTIYFAVLGDYGSGSEKEADVADLVKSWHPNFITTVGDNNYPVGSALTIDRNIGKYFHQYIGNYKGYFGKGAATNRFFPIPGHRDWDSENLSPYLNYFSLPGNGRYYDFVWGPVHFFMLDTDVREPDGGDVTSKQANWLKERLSKSRTPWNLVYAHHAPYTSHTVEDIVRMRWPFESWGASAVLSGYFHVYERLSVDGIPYFINGAGGAWVSGFGAIDPHSLFRFNGDNGAMLVEASFTSIVFRFINRKGELIDTYEIKKGQKDKPVSQEK